jgi:signal transduction histidine kinase/CheY-like chemotaxis protein
MSTELVRVEVRDTAGVFSARQVGREVAAELGLERQDQVRVATALSEVGRELIIAGQVATMVFLAGDGELIIRVEHDGPPPGDALTAAGRLMERVSTAGPALEMARSRPAGRGVDLAAASRRLAALLPVSALDELRRQNEDLIGALAEVQRQKAELLLLNAELEETNQGVMALYSQLSDELEQTNRGVVALYAELEEKSERLREASEAKNRFWANVSHELRSPLNSIIGLGRLLTSAGSELTADQRHQVSLIVGAGLGLLGLVNDLLDTAKAESGRLQADPAVIELPALLARLRALLRPMTENRPVSLIVDADGGPAELLTDEVALTAILRNLLSNGLKYTDDGEVRLTVSAGEGHVDFVVADTGIGVPAGQTERIFEEFFQVSGVRRGGTGLGLPYARRLTELLGGHLSLESEPGHGTTVTLRLPHGTPVLGTVLIADDDAAFRQLVRGLLAGLAGQVIEAADGEQALAAALAGPVDLALVDLRMPGLDGYALLERLPPGLPAIIISSQDPGELPPRAGGALRKDQLTADRLRYAITQVAAIDRSEGAGDE